MFTKIDNIHHKATHKIAQLAIPAFIMGIVLGSAGVALATTASGPYGYYGPIYGYQYYNEAGVSTISTGANATTWVGSYQDSTIPIGYMGGFARLYNSNGVLEKYSSWTYNASAVYAMAVTSPTDGVHQSYYSYGVTAAYNGNGYDYYYTFKSPDVTY